MALIYKPGQGYWTRMLSAVGFGTLVLAGVAWLWAEMPGWAPKDDVYLWRAGVAAGVVLVFGVLLWYLLNKPNIVEFMIATEAEMKKVNWPSKKEIYGSTVVVIGGTLLMAALLAGVDLVFVVLFRAINIIG